MSDDEVPYSGQHSRVFQDFNRMFSTATLETRAENAFGVAVKFMSLLDGHVDDDDELKKLKSAWYKSVRDNDFKKFRRALNRYNRRDQE